MFNFNFLFYFRYILFFQDPATATMEGILEFHDFVFFFLVLIFVFVLLSIINLFYFFWVKFRGLENKFDFKFRKHLYVHRNLNHNTLLEFIWTLVPCLILGTILFPSISLLYAMDELFDPALTVKVLASQWYWSYEYSNVFLNEPYNIFFDSYMLGIDDLSPGQMRLLEVDNFLVLPKNFSIRVLVTSNDVLHCWAIPAFGVKIDAVPGRLNQILLMIDRSGIFYGQCSEICGVNHGFMPICIRSVDISDFLNWVLKGLGDLSLFKTFFIDLQVFIDFFYFFFREFKFNYFYYNEKSVFNFCNDQKFIFNDFIYFNNINLFDKFLNYNINYNLKFFSNLTIFNYYKSLRYVNFLNNFFFLYNEYDDTSLERILKLKYNRFFFLDYSKFFEMLQSRLSLYRNFVYDLKINRKYYLKSQRNFKFFFFKEYLLNLVVSSRSKLAFLRKFNHNVNHLRSFHNEMFKGRIHVRDYNDDFIKYFNKSQKFKEIFLSGKIFDVFNKKFDKVNLKSLLLLRRNYLNKNIKIIDDTKLKLKKLSLDSHAFRSNFYDNFNLNNDFNNYNLDFNNSNSGNSSQFLISSLTNSQNNIDLSNSYYSNEIINGADVYLKKFLIEEKYLNNLKNKLPFKKFSGNLKYNIDKFGLLDLNKKKKNKLLKGGVKNLKNIMFKNNEELNFRKSFLQNSRKSSNKSKFFSFYGSKDYAKNVIRLLYANNLNIENENIESKNFNLKKNYFYKFDFGRDFNFEQDLPLNNDELFIHNKFYDEDDSEEEDIFFDRGNIINFDEKKEKHLYGDYISTSFENADSSEFYNLTSNEDIFNINFQDNNDLNFNRNKKYKSEFLNIYKLLLSKKKLTSNIKDSFKNYEKSKITDKLNSGYDNYFALFHDINKNGFFKFDDKMSDDSIYSVSYLEDLEYHKPLYNIMFKSFNNYLFESSNLVFKLDNNLINLDENEYDLINPFGHKDAYLNKNFNLNLYSRILKTSRVNNMIDIDLFSKSYFYLTNNFYSKNILKHYYQNLANNFLNFDDDNEDSFPSYSSSDLDENNEFVIPDDKLKFGKNFLEKSNFNLSFFRTYFKHIATENFIDIRNVSNKDSLHGNPSFIPDISNVFSKYRFSLSLSNNKLQNLKKNYNKKISGFRKSNFDFMHGDFNFSSDEINYFKDKDLLIEQKEKNFKLFKKYSKNLKFGNNLLSRDIKSKARYFTIEKFKNLETKYFNRAVIFNDNAITNYQKYIDFSNNKIKFNKIFKNNVMKNSNFNDINNKFFFKFNDNGFLLESSILKDRLTNLIKLKLNRLDIFSQHKFFNNFAYNDYDFIINNIGQLKGHKKNDNYKLYTKNVSRKYDGFYEDDDEKNFDENNQFYNINNLNSLNMSSFFPENFSINKLSFEYINNQRYPFLGDKNFWNLLPESKFLNFDYFYDLFFFRRSDLNYLLNFSVSYKFQNNFRKNLNNFINESYKRFAFRKSLTVNDRLFLIFFDNNFLKLKRSRFYKLKSFRLQFFNNLKFKDLQFQKSLFFKQFYNKMSYFDFRTYYSYFLFFSLNDNNIVLANNILNLQFKLNNLNKKLYFLFNFTYFSNFKILYLMNFFNFFNNFFNFKLKFFKKFIFKKFNILIGNSFNYYLEKKNLNLKFFFFNFYKFSLNFYILNFKLYFKFENFYLKIFKFFNFLIFSKIYFYNFSFIFFNFNFFEVLNYKFKFNVAYYKKLLIYYKKMFNLKNRFFNLSNGFIFKFFDYKGNNRIFFDYLKVSFFNFFFFSKLNFFIFDNYKTFNIKEDYLMYFRKNSINNLYFYLFFFEKLSSLSNFFNFYNNFNYKFLYNYNFILYINELFLFNHSFHNFFLGRKTILDFNNFWQLYNYKIYIFDLLYLSNNIFLKKNKLNVKNFNLNFYFNYFYYKFNFKLFYNINKRFNFYNLNFKILDFYKLRLLRLKLYVKFYIFNLISKGYNFKDLNFESLLKNINNSIQFSNYNVFENINQINLKDLDKILTFEKFLLRKEIQYFFFKFLNVFGKDDRFKDIGYMFNNYIDFYLDSTIFLNRKHLLLKEFNFFFDFYFLNIKKNNKFLDYIFNFFDSKFFFENFYFYKLDNILFFNFIENLNSFSLVFNKFLMSNNKFSLFFFYNLDYYSYFFNLINKSVINYDKFKDIKNNVSLKNIRNNKLYNYKNLNYFYNTANLRNLEFFFNFGILGNTSASSQLDDNSDTNIFNTLNYPDDDDISSKENLLEDDDSVDDQADDFIFEIYPNLDFNSKNLSFFNNYFFNILDFKSNILRLFGNMKFSNFRKLNLNYILSHYKNKESLFKNNFNLNFNEFLFFDPIIYNFSFDFEGRDSESISSLTDLSLFNFLDEDFLSDNGLSYDENYIDFLQDVGYDDDSKFSDDNEESSTGDINESGNFEAFDKAMRFYYINPTNMDYDNNNLKLKYFFFNNLMYGSKVSDLDLFSNYNIETDEDDDDDEDDDNDESVVDDDEFDVDSDNIFEEDISSEFLGGIFNNYYFFNTNIDDIFNFANKNFNKTKTLFKLNMLDNLDLYKDMEIFDKVFAELGIKFIFKNNKFMLNKDYFFLLFRIDNKFFFNDSNFFNNLEYTDKLFLGKQYLISKYYINYLNNIYNFKVFFQKNYNNFLFGIDYNFDLFFKLYENDNIFDDNDDHDFLNFNTIIDFQEFDKIFDINFFDFNFLNDFFCTDYYFYDLAYKAYLNVNNNNNNNFLNFEGFFLENFNDLDFIDFYDKLFDNNYFMDKKINYLKYDLYNYYKLPKFFSYPTINFRFYKFYKSGSIDFLEDDSIHDNDEDPDEEDYKESADDLDVDSEEFDIISDYEEFDTDSLNVSGFDDSDDFDLDDDKEEGYYDFDDILSDNIDDFEEDFEFDDDYNKLFFENFKISEFVIKDSVNFDNFLLNFGRFFFEVEDYESSYRFFNLKKFLVNYRYSLLTFFSNYFYFLNHYNFFNFKYYLYSQFFFYKKYYFTNFFNFFKIYFISLYLDYLNFFYYNKFIQSFSNYFFFDIFFKNIKFKSRYTVNFKYNFKIFNNNFFNFIFFRKLYKFYDLDKIFKYDYFKDNNKNVDLKLNLVEYFNLKLLKNNNYLFFFNNLFNFNYNFKNFYKFNTEYSNTDDEEIIYFSNDDLVDRLVDYRRSLFFKRNNNKSFFAVDKFDSLFYSYGLKKLANSNNIYFKYSNILPLKYLLWDSDLIISKKYENNLKNNLKNNKNTSLKNKYLKIFNNYLKSNYLFFGDLSNKTQNYGLKNNFEFLKKNVIFSDVFLFDSYFFYKMNHFFSNFENLSGNLNVFDRQKFIAYPEQDEDEDDEEETNFSDFASFLYFPSNFKLFNKNSLFLNNKFDLLSFNNLNSLNVFDFFKNYTINNNYMDKGEFLSFFDDPRSFFDSSTLFFKNGYYKQNIRKESSLLMEKSKFPEFVRTVEWVDKNRYKFIKFQKYYKRKDRFFKLSNSRVIDNYSKFRTSGSDFYELDYSKNLLYFIKFFYFFSNFFYNKVFFNNFFKFNDNFKLRHNYIKFLNSLEFFNFLGFDFFFFERFLNFFDFFDFFQFYDDTRLGGNTKVYYNNDLNIFLFQILRNYYFLLNRFFYENFYDFNNLLFLKKNYLYQRFFFKQFFYNYIIFDYFFNNLNFLFYKKFKFFFKNNQKIKLLKNLNFLFYKKIFNNYFLNFNFFFFNKFFFKFYQHYFYLNFNLIFNFFDFNIYNFFFFFKLLFYNLKFNSNLKYKFNFEKNILNYYNFYYYNNYFKVFDYRLDFLEYFVFKYSKKFFDFFFIFKFLNFFIFNNDDFLYLKDYNKELINLNYFNNDWFFNKKIFKFNNNFNFNFENSYFIEDIFNLFKSDRQFFFENFFQSNFFGDYNTKFKNLKKHRLYIYLLKNYGVLNSKNNNFLNNLDFKIFKEFPLYNININKRFLENFYIFLNFNKFKWILSFFEESYNYSLGTLRLSKNNLRYNRYFINHDGDLVLKRLKRSLLIPSGISSLETDFKNNKLVKNFINNSDFDKFNILYQNYEMFNDDFLDFKLENDNYSESNLYDFVNFYKKSNKKKLVDNLFFNNSYMGFINNYALRYSDIFLNSPLFSSIFGTEKLDFDNYNVLKNNFSNYKLTALNSEFDFNGDKEKVWFSSGFFSNFFNEETNHFVTGDGFRRGFSFLFRPRLFYFFSNLRLFSDENFKFFSDKYLLKIFKYTIFMNCFGKLFNDYDFYNYSTFRIIFLIYRNFFKLRRLLMFQKRKDLIFFKFFINNNLDSKFKYNKQFFFFFEYFYNFIFNYKFNFNKVFLIGNFFNSRKSLIFNNYLYYYFFYNKSFFYLFYFKFLNFFKFFFNISIFSNFLKIISNNNFKFFDVLNFDFLYFFNFFFFKDFHFKNLGLYNFYSKFEINNLNLNTEQVFFKSFDFIFFKLVDYIDNFINNYFEGFVSISSKINFLSFRFFLEYNLKYKNDIQFNRFSKDINNNGFKNDFFLKNDYNFKVFLKNDKIFDNYFMGNFYNSFFFKFFYNGFFLDNFFDYLFSFIFKGKFFLDVTNIVKFISNYFFFDINNYNNFYFFNLMVINYFLNFNFFFFKNINYNYIFHNMFLKSYFNFNYFNLFFEYYLKFCFKFFKIKQNKSIQNINDFFFFFSFYYFIFDLSYRLFFPRVFRNDRSRVVPYQNNFRISLKDFKISDLFFDVKFSLIFNSIFFKFKDNIFFNIKFKNKYLDNLFFFNINKNSVLFLNILPYYSKFIFEFNLNFYFNNLKFNNELFYYDNDYFKYYFNLKHYNIFIFYYFRSFLF